ncbi:hypothetical protein SscP1EGY_17 [Streptomyces phage SscP1EGY]|nr:hypothetical protein SscP1EGY_17 [Streptomyces phage SscP1EGY]
MVILERLNWIGEVPVTMRHVDGEGDVTRVAKVEKLKSGALVYHINLTGEGGLDFLRRGFSLGELPATEEEEDE